MESFRSRFVTGFWMVFEWRYMDSVDFLVRIPLTCQHFVCKFDNLLTYFNYFENISKDVLENLEYHGVKIETSEV